MMNPEIDEWKERAGIEEWKERGGIDEWKETNEWKERGIEEWKEINRTGIDEWKQKEEIREINQRLMEESGEEIVTTKEISSMHIPGVADLKCDSKIETKDAIAYVVLFIIATFLICAFLYSHKEYIYGGDILIAAVAVVMAILFYVGFTYNNACGYYLNIGLLLLLFLSILAWGANVARRAYHVAQGNKYYGNGFLFLIIILLLLIFYMYTVRDKLTAVLLLLVPIAFFCLMTYLWLYEF